MLSTEQRLYRLETILKEKNAPVLEHFNPGLPQDKVESFLQAHNIKPIPSLVALYEWHNGVKTVYGYKDGILELLPFGNLFNLEEMLQIREVFREWAEEDFTDLDNFVPFLGSGESDMYLLNLTTGQVLGYRPMIQVVGDVEFQSIDSMLDCIIECLEKGAFTIDPKDGMDVDFERYTEIREKLLQLEK